ncbi:MAG: hypothetical protein JO222_11310, partial [Frankiales bacterium]|nr:hypothetical protein [Frankiales bacterium]
ATGLAIATVAPLNAHVYPAHTAPRMTPALQVKAAAHHVRQHHNAISHAVATKTTATKTATGAPSHVSSGSTPIGPPVLCGHGAAGHHVSAGCVSHHGPTVYVKLPVPVAGTHEIGISKDGNTLCPVVPTTSVTSCDSSTGSHPSPSKGK